jgi:hypothetical protein
MLSGAWEKGKTDEGVPASPQGEKGGRFAQGGRGEDGSARLLDVSTTLVLTDLPTYRLADLEPEYSYGDVHDVDDPGLSR